MAIVNEQSVLNFYLKEIEEDAIAFLKGKEAFKKKIKENIEHLSIANNMNEKIEISKKLWKLLFESAMSYIDPDKRGYDELFQFFDEYVEFEELIFASDSFYRDHTFHCLWVYFLGVYITKTKEYGYLFQNYNKEISIIKALNEGMELMGVSNEVKQFSYVLNEIIKIENYQDSIYCISALTHDLGYPLKKVGKINKSISKILPYFSIHNYNEFQFQFNSLQNNNIDSFIDMITEEIGIDYNSEDDNFDEIMSKVLVLKNDVVVGINQEAIRKLDQEEIKKFKLNTNLNIQLTQDVSKRINYCNDFEEYQHGIMSAYLLTKVIKSFTSSKLIYSNKSSISPYHVDFADISAKKLILNSVTDHTCSGFRVRDIDSPSALLTVIDELEEFSRISRANQNRQYITEFCKTDLYIDEGVFHIDFIFDNEEIENLDPERAFKGRCKRFLTLFDISKLSEKLQLQLRCIANLPYDKNIYSLEIRNKFAKIMINEEEKNIPEYLKGRQFYSREDYANL